MALTKASLSEKLSSSLKFNRREAKNVVEEFFAEVIHSLSIGEAVKLSGFGNFLTRYKHARPGRNPKTGEAVEITARRVVTFRAGQKLKAKVEAYIEKNQQAASNHED